MRPRSPHDKEEGSTDRCWMVLAAGLIAILAAAHGQVAAAGDQDGRLDLPRYSIGDTRTWNSDGVEWTETAIAVEGDLVTWHASNGDIVKTSANFVLPAIEHHQSSHGSGRTEIVEADGDIFPLETGKWLSLRIRGHGDDEARTRFCRVGQWSEVGVPAGRFEVVEVSCQELNRTKVWYYAPAIGTFVRYLNKHRYERTVAQDLVAIQRAEP
jgi:hypothetical protein